MDTLVSSWCKDIKSLPENYVFPPDQRPGELLVPPCENPAIDLSKAVDHKQSETIDRIIKAGHEFGFFQVINHGIPQRLIDEATGVVKEFFDMPAELKTSAFKPDSTKRCRLYTSSLDYKTEKVHFWRDNLTHPCHPLEDCLHLWPEKPTKYREVVGKYSLEVRKLVLKILDLIYQGIGLEEGFFDGDEMDNIQLLSLNYYPRCPEPSLAMGIHRHCDPNIINILSQGDASGLQVLKNGKWMGVEPIPDALVVILGCQLQIMSNDKLKAVEHRVVTNSKEDRITISYFIIPSYDCFIKPAKDLVSNCNAPMYKGFLYKEFLNAYVETKGEYEALMDYFKF